MFGCTVAIGGTMFVIGAVLAVAGVGGHELMFVGALGVPLFGAIIEVWR